MVSLCDPAYKYALSTSHLSSNPILLVRAASKAAEAAVTPVAFTAMVVVAIATAVVVVLVVLAAGRAVSRVKTIYER